MNARRLLSAVLSLVIAVLAVDVARPQGFAGLGSDAEGFELPLRGRPIVFPADHGAHAGFRIEWWYVTANLVAEDGRRFGAQWTLFRSALAPGNRPGWSDPQIWIGHAAVTTQQHHYVAERLGRGGVGQAGVEIEPFRAWIDDWEMRSRSNSGEDALANVDLVAKGADFSYRLALTAKGPLVLQGDRGYSVKSEAGQASHYYSQPFYTVSGEIVIDGKPIRVSGQAWLDREWSSQPLASDQTGWDWFSIHFATGAKLMAFRLRDNGDGYISANWITPDGTTEPMTAEAVVLEPVRHAQVNGRDVPVAWRLRIPEKGIDVTTEPVNDQSWMTTSTPYWEGPISVQGSTAGVGYLEMTGY